MEAEHSGPLRENMTAENVCELSNGTEHVVIVNKDRKRIFQQFRVANQNFFPIRLLVHIILLGFWLHDPKITSQQIIPLLG